MVKIKDKNGVVFYFNFKDNSIKKAPSETAERYIVFLDIMGFKDRVARTNHNELFEMLSEFNNRITRHINEHKKHGINLSQFSDSILIYSSDNDLDSLLTISKVTANIMETAISCGIPLKGAIAKGTVTCDTIKQLFFGQALIDAYLLEENVKYYGVLAHNSVEADISKLEKNNDTPFRDVEAPLKSGSVFHYEISWYKNSPQTAKENLKKIRETVSGDPRKYIDNSLKVIDSPDKE